MRQPTWKLPLLLFMFGCLASLGQKAYAADSSRDVAQVVRGCQYGDFPKYFSRVTTNDGDPLRVRSTPSGEAIGAIPNGWAVVVLEWSRNGVWARVSSHFGEIENPGFGSAPDFREGWVAAAYLKDLGRFCDKPESVSQLVQPELFGQQPLEIQGDWLALADRLADTAFNP